MESPSLPAETGTARAGVVLISGLIGMVLAGIVLLGTATMLADARGDVESLAYGDGLIYRYVAGHLTTPPEDVHPVVAERGTALRYGRIGMPALIYLFALGQRDWIPYAHVAVIVLAAGMTSAAAAALFPRAGPAVGATPFLAPGVPLAISGGFAEIVALAFALWAVWAAVTARWWLMVVLVSAAILTRENAGVVLIGLSLWFLLRRRWGPSAGIYLALLPLAGWYAVTAARFGYIPPLDPYLRTTTETVGLPFLAMLRSFTRPSSGSALAMALGHVAAGVAAWLMLRRNVFALLAAIASLQLLITGPFGWEIAGEAIRTTVFLQVFLMLSVVAQRLSPEDPLLLTRRNGDSPGITIPADASP